MTAGRTHCQPTGTCPTHVLHCAYKVVWIPQDWTETQSQFSFLVFTRIQHYRSTELCWTYSTCVRFFQIYMKQLSALSLSLSMSQMSQIAWKSCALIGRPCGPAHISRASAHYRTSQQRLSCRCSSFHTGRPSVSRLLTRIWVFLSASRGWTCLDYLLGDINQH